MVKVSIPYRAEIICNEQGIHVQGSALLIDKVGDLFRALGSDPSRWSLQKVVSGEDVLINEFILKCQNQPSSSYLHEELCHCRMVNTDKVTNAIKQGAFSVREISRVTLAGTGCGSCKKDIEELLSFHVK